MHLPANVQFPCKRHTVKTQSFFVVFSASAFPNRKTSKRKTRQTLNFSFMISRIVRISCNLYIERIDSTKKGEGFGCGPPPNPSSLPHYSCLINAKSIPANFATEGHFPASIFLSTRARSPCQFLLLSLACSSYKIPCTPPPITVIIPQISWHSNTRYRNAFRYVRQAPIFVA